jgi:protein SCO1
VGASSSPRRTPTPALPRSTRGGRNAVALALVACLLLFTAAAHADTPPAYKSPLDDIGIDQNLGQQVPADLMFKDENGHDVRLGQYFHGKPVILTLVYFECPMLCTMVLNDLVRSLNMVSLEPGRDFEMVTVSFDPGDTPDLAYRKKRSYLSAYQRDGAEAGWHFLTGQQLAITALTKAVGFRYHWDPIHQVFAHASGIMVLTPAGKLSRYYFGIDYAPVDLKLSLIDASGDTIGSKTDQILLYCCAYDPSTGRYGWVIARLLQIFGGLTVLALALLIGLLQLKNVWRTRAGANPIKRTEAPA